MKRLILLLAAVTAVLMLSPTGFAQSNYTWALVCKGAAADGSAGTGATWVWLHDGVQISLNSGSPNGFASCATPPLSGNGEIPATINGIQVNGISVNIGLSEFPAGCQGFAIVTKSFDPSNPKISISVNVSAPGKAKTLGGTVDCPNASFHFSLTS